MKYTVEDLWLAREEMYAAKEHYDFIRGLALDGQLDDTDGYSMTVGEQLPWSIPTAVLIDAFGEDAIADIQSTLKPWQVVRVRDAKASRNQRRYYKQRRVGGAINYE